MADLFLSLISSLSNAITVIGPVSLASVVVLLASTSAVVIPMLGPGTGAFVYQWFMAAVGFLPKRKKVWGTVYDARTKRPIPFARVQLLDRNKRVLETRVADKNGRYGFLTMPESLSSKDIQAYLEISHHDYAFPSKTPISVDKLVYGNLYYGELLTISEKELINFDVPMDPLRPPKTPFVLASPSITLGISVAAIADASFWLGLVVVPLNFILQPNPFSFGVLCLFLGAASLRLFGISEHPYGVIKDSQTGRPMPFALITLSDMDGKRTAFTVSDESGRYFMVVDGGKYMMDVFTSSDIAPQRKNQIFIEAKRGWITKEIRL